MNYFDLFQLPVSPHVDKEVLLLRYLEMSKNAQKKGLEDLALLNQAYQTLRDRMRRLEYFLRLKKIGIDPREAKITDSFLEEVASYRGRISSAVNPADKNRIKSNIEAKITNLLDSMQKALDQGRADLVGSIFVQIKYLAKIIGDAQG